MDVEVITEDIDQTMTALFASKHQSSLLLTDAFRYNANATYEPLDITLRHTLSSIILHQLDDVIIEDVSIHDVIVKDDVFKCIHGIREPDIIPKYAKMYEFFGGKVLPDNIRWHFDEYEYEKYLNVCDMCGRSGLHILNSNSNLCNTCINSSDLSEKLITF